MQKTMSALALDIASSDATAPGVLLALTLAVVAFVVEMRLPGPVRSAAVVALALTLDKQPMQLGLLKEGDWAGIATMAIGLSAFQTVLEEGEKNDWFASSFIVELAIIAAVFLGAFIWIELTVQKPLVGLFPYISP